MSAPVDVLAAPSFAGRWHAQWMVVAGDNPREKWVHDAGFGHYGMSVAKVSFEHEYSHNPECAAKMSADYAERLVACADAMKGIADPRAFRAAMDEMIEAAKAFNPVDPNVLARGDTYTTVGIKIGNVRRLQASLARVGGAQ